MKPLDEIKMYYPPGLVGHDLDILREYLQYEMRQIIYASEYSERLVFLGGTCLRIVYDTGRFSEDLDFDNLGLSWDDFEVLTDRLAQGLNDIGYACTTGLTVKGAYHCAVRFRPLVYTYGLSPHKEATLLIKLDTERQHYAYTPHRHALDKFGIQHDIRAVPADLLCAMKIAAVLGRKHAKGRDFYDLDWLLQRGITPDYGYLEQKLNIASAKTLRERVNSHADALDFEALARDVSPFLLRKEDVERVRTFPQMWAEARL